MTRLVLLGGALSIIAFLAACGGSSSGGQNASPSTPTVNAPTPDGPEYSFAKSMILTAADFPGYIETPDTRPESDHPINAFCSQEAEKGKTGRAVSSGFAPNSSAPVISEAVLVYANDDDAKAGLDATPALVDCAANVVNAGKLNKSGFELSGATSRKIVVDAPGDASYAFEVQANGKTTGPTATDFNLTITMVFARMGRVSYHLTISGAGNPLSPEEVAGYAKQAAARIKQQP